MELVIVKRLNIQIRIRVRLGNAKTDKGIGRGIFLIQHMVEKSRASDLSVEVAQACHDALKIWIKGTRTETQAIIL